MKFDRIISGFFCIFLIGMLPVNAADSAAGKVAKYFDGYEGTCVVHDTSGKQLCEFNDALASKGESPCSTFKIVIALIGLETGAIKDENEIEKWDGVKQPVETWNKDYNLKAAMKESVNWYFQSVDKKIGKEKMEKYLKLLHYGNEDMSSNFDNFWMGNAGSLRISPKQQVDFLEHLYAETLPFSKKTQDIVRSVLKCDEHPSAVLYGKTGTDSENGILNAGWFAGFVEGKNGNCVFATHIRGAHGVTGAKAREITKKVLTELGYW